MLIAFPIFRRIFKKYDALNNLRRKRRRYPRCGPRHREHETTKFRFGFSRRGDFTNAEKLIALNSPS